MSRIRSVHPGLASDEAFMSMSIEAKAAWPLLWTECDDHGVFEWKPIVLKARIFPANNIDFAAILDELEALNCVQRFEAGGRSYGIVRNFCSYQRPKSPSYRYPFPDEIAEYAAFKTATSDKPTESLPQGYPRATENPPQMKEEVGIEEGKKDTPARKRADSPSDDFPKDGFEVWYTEYPRHEGREAARKAFERVRRKGQATFAHLMAGAKRYRALAATIDRQFVKMPATWLNAGCWDDEDVKASVATELPPDQIMVMRDSPQWTKFAAVYRERKGRDPPVGNSGSWIFPKEYERAFQEAAE